MQATMDEEEDFWTFSTRQQPNNNDSTNENPKADELSSTQESFLSKWSPLIWITVFAFFYITDPSQPFLVPFLTSKGFSAETVLQSVFPVWTYSMPVVQIVVGIISETKLGHKWLISGGLVLNLGVLLIVIFARKRDLWLLQLSEVIISFLFSSHQSFFAYRYHVTKPEQYQLITGLTRGAMLIGCVFGAVIGQSLFLLGVPLVYLFYIAIGFCVPCILISIIVFSGPSKYVVPIDVNPKLAAIKNADELSDYEEKQRKTRSQWEKFYMFPVDVFNCYATNFNVLYWSCFIIASVSVHHLAVTYYQILFRTLDKVHVFNGYLMAVAYTFAGILSFVPMKIEKITDQYGKPMGIVCSILCALCLASLSFQRIPIIVAYAVFILYHSLFEFTLVIGMSQIAKSMKLSRFAAVFSVNACAQSLVQVVIQFIIGKRVLKLGPLMQYRAFGFCVLGSVTISIVLIVIRYVIKLVNRLKNPRSFGPLN